LKPWKKFRKMNAVLAFLAKNSSGKSALSFVSFLCANKDKENNKLQMDLSG
jgi:hypothetical protein